MKTLVATGLSSATADLSDRFGDSAQIMDLPWRSFGGRDVFHGPAATFAAEDDTVLIRQMLETKGENRVLVIDNRGSSRHAVLGDRFAALALENGWGGVIINGVIRDAEAVGRMDVGVVAIGTSPRRPHKQGAGISGITLYIAGAKISPGDWVAVDADGAIVIDASALAE
ncbi:ribonuclease E activity regulator RraA [Agrobacterium tumefaciens]|uniref:ribonuclease E activity regulator RraA n=1 Tax=Agrobacterium tumefaciens TaxID=358 RepID=UPI0015719800|nr:ribonuclease E activity regulator RraA [Agrobacterium tumefaciens]NTE66249.1 ribonuclease E activity regulator RraA [Agrobacterium tumefaciens]